eukprot:TRINITY_DN7065_c0_g1_i1.p1 TRINITY_DN7065_c0_g1~~TRINITY_DN7065_c0_g1_i1.p1  ORF type:complete len:150 (-),score=35.71 TRINITY_DN7065_c0_g1_i1:363-812(-)
MVLGARVSELILALNSAASTYKEGVRIEKELPLPCVRSLRRTFEPFESNGCSKWPAAAADAKPWPTLEELYERDARDERVRHYVLDAGGLGKLSKAALDEELTSATYWDLKMTIIESRRLALRIGRRSTFELLGALFNAVEQRMATTPQ